MTIIVATQACRTSGALTIYRQFLSHLAENVNGHIWILFIDPSMDHPIIEGVEYVFDSGHSWRERIRWNRKGLLNWLEEKRISPDCIVSLQNTGVITDCPQVIYYHQSIPFYSKKWNIFKSSERIMWAYKHVYPYFVKETLNPKTEVVVQIPFIKHGFCKRFKFAPSKIHILFPDVNLPAVEDVEPADDGYTHFIYPATPLPYKGHIQL